MTATVTGIDDELTAAFGRARGELVEARRRYEEKDTPASRRTVSECLARIDGVLDLYLDMGLGPAGVAPAGEPRPPAGRR